MDRIVFARRIAATLVAVVALITVSGRANAQSLSALNGELSALAPRVSAATSGADYAEANEVVAQLDQAEANFAKIAENLRADKGAFRRHLRAVGRATRPDVHGVQAEERGLSRPG